MGREAVKVLRDHPLNPEVTAYDVLDRLLKACADTGRAACTEECCTATEPMQWTIDPCEIKMRLVDYLNPSSLEILVVSLLQLEHPKEVWQHTGGPGDGGIDGFGHDGAGDTVGLLQVKFAAERPIAFDKPPEDHGIQLYVAVVLPEHPRWRNDGAKHLDLDWIGRKVLKHWERLPQALAMRVGEG